LLLRESALAQKPAAINTAPVDNLVM